MPNTTDPSLVNYERPEVTKARPDLMLIADLLAGTRRMWDQSQTAHYIRKWADEKQEVYDIRRRCETLFEGLARVLSASVGMLFSKPPAVVWNASEMAMREHWQDLDAMGTAGPVLAKRFADQGIRDGLGLIFVDHPLAPAGTVVTQANEMALGLRPTWAMYQRRQAVSWRPGVVNNRAMPVQLVLEECGHEPDGLYGVKAVTRYRVLRLLPTAGEDGTPDGGHMATWALWEERNVAGVAASVKVREGVFTNRKGQVADFLPVAIAYTGRTDAMLCATMPLLGVAWANLAHWRLSTALTFAREVASYAQAVIVGDLAPEPGANGATVPGRVKLGPLAVIHLQGEGATFDWKAPPVDAFAALERGTKEKLEQIGQMGMSFLVSDTRAAETAEAKRLDATAENSTLATAAQGIEDALNMALEMHAWYLGIEKAGAPVLTINKDFEATVMEPAVMLAYVQAAKDIGFPVIELLRAFQAGGRIPEDTDVEAMAMDMMAEQAAMADAKEQAAADAAAMVGAGPRKRMPPDQMAA